MSIQSKLNQATTLILEAFAQELSKHKLSSKMTPDQIMAFFDMDSISVSISSKSTPAKKTEDLPEWKKELGDLPGGILKKRALALLALAQAGVPDGFKIHTQKVELFKLNKQHEKFYTKGVFSGPQKEKNVIKWLCKQGEFGAPPEPKIVAELPTSHKWEGDKKKAAKLLKLVQAHKKKAEEEEEEYKYVSWNTSRGHKKDDDNFLYNADYEICGPKEYKSEFLNLIAWLDENADFVEKSRKETVPKAKGKKAVNDDSESENPSDSDDEASEKPKGKKAKDDSDDEASEKPKGKKATAKEDDSDDEASEKPKGKKAKEDDSDDETSEKPKGKKAKEDSDDEASEKPKGKKAKEDSDDEASEKPKGKGKKAAKHTDSDDSDDEAEKDGPMFVLDYDQKKLNALKTKLKKLETEGSEKYVNAKSRLEIGRTDKSEKKFKWLDNKVAIPIESEYVADDFIKMLAQ
jgi:hypothetical protein